MIPFKIAKYINNLVRRFPISTNRNSIVPMSNKKKKRRSKFQRQFEMKKKKDRKWCEQTRHRLLNPIFGERKEGKFRE